MYASRMPSMDIGRDSRSQTPLFARSCCYSIKVKINAIFSTSA